MDPTTQSIVPAMANMQLVAAHAQNQALQANNEANTQMLQLMEKMQITFQTLVEENARISAEMQSLKAQIKTERDLHLEEIKALKDQNTALQNQVDDIAKKEVALEKMITDKAAKLDENISTLKVRYDKHSHQYFKPMSDRGDYNLATTGPST